MRYAAGGRLLPGPLSWVGQGLRKYPYVCFSLYLHSRTQERCVENGGIFWLIAQIIYELKKLGISNLEGV